MSHHPRLSPARKAQINARLPPHCAHCRATTNLTLDHILARALGGTNAVTNLQRLCAACNAAKAVVEHAQSQAIRRKAFAQRAQRIHGARYDYTRVLHPEGKGNITIACPDHGPFWLTPAAHLAGTGCPRCRKEAAKAARQRHHLHLLRYGTRF